ncbi:MAG: lysine-2,3-aminomutase-like protein [Rhodospirillaceae bacterium]|nr:lysine-2,3-aminomutase-like protein [Rhodospirillaceae bacterium]MBT5374889.1 lysine-2,3-aminomutase-like protein [Rhodospirillaceae bacterium]MBT5659459.1 lysine-2,3-aminomutase-like protein [Rhodospirillaceae bacterium]
MTYPRKKDGKSLKSLADLAQAGLIGRAEIDPLNTAAENFPIVIPPGLQARLAAETPTGPLHRQFIPSADESVTGLGESPDPIGDQAFSPVKGIIHRYPDRVLLTPLTLCPVHCRYCFRRDSVGSPTDAMDGTTDPAALTGQEMDTAFAYIRDNPSVWEVILSGGDPLMLSARRLGDILETLAAIPHVAVVRIHSRIPVITPERLTEEIIDLLGNREFPAIYMILHLNHADELTDESLEICRKLTAAGIVLLGQTVLLKGVNNDPDILADLFRQMVKNRIKPYYLHHCDMAQGTGHFRTTIAEGQNLMRALRGRLSGLCQPTYVLDIPGGHGKVPLTPDYLHQTGEDEGLLVEDYQGGFHAYPPSGPPAP